MQEFTGKNGEGDCDDAVDDYDYVDDDVDEDDYVDDDTDDDDYVDDVNDSDDDDGGVNLLGFVFMFCYQHKEL